MGFFVFFFCVCFFVLCFWLVDCFEVSMINIVVSV